MVFIRTIYWLRTWIPCLVFCLFSVAVVAVVYVVAAVVYVVVAVVIAVVRVVAVVYCLDTVIGFIFPRALSSVVTAVVVMTVFLGRIPNARLSVFVTVVSVPVVSGTLRVGPPLRGVSRTTIALALFAVLLFLLITRCRLILAT